MRFTSTITIAVATALLVSARPSGAVVPPSPDWIELQRYANGASNGKFHVVYLVPNGRSIYMLKISNFTDMGPVTIERVQSFEMGAPVPPGRSWALIQRYEQNPTSGEGEVRFESVFAIPSGNEIHVIRASNLKGWVIERLPTSPVQLPP